MNSTSPSPDYSFLLEFYLEFKALVKKGFPSSLTYLDIESGTPVLYWRPGNDGIIYRASPSFDVLRSSTPQHFASSMHRQYDEFRQSSTEWTPLADGKDGAK